MPCPGLRVSTVPQIGTAGFCKIRANHLGPHLGFARIVPPTVACRHLTPLMRTALRATLLHTTAPLRAAPTSAAVYLRFQNPGSCPSQYLYRSARTSTEMRADLFKDPRGPLLVARGPLPVAHVLSYYVVPRFRRLLRRWYSHDATNNTYLLLFYAYVVLVGLL